MSQNFTHKNKSNLVLADQTQILSLLKESFAAKFGDSKHAIIAMAPGRVNLIGDHTDYNDGFVLPMTIGRAVYIAAHARTDNTCHVHSLNFDADASWQLNSIVKTKDNYWSNYIKGVMQVLQQAGYKLGGIDAVVYGHVPIGAGLSSSAAIEVASVCALDDLFALNLSPIDAIKLAQQAENEFIGMRCGIMDQFVSRLGKKGHALFLDCRSLEYKQIPIKLGDNSLLIVDTRVKRELVNSAYNERRASCEEAVKLCQKLYPKINALRDLTPEMFNNCLQKLQLPQVEASRARHVVLENQRVNDAIIKLEKNDLAGFGALLYQSHASLKDDYEVSCPELDFIVDAARKFGALGARLTGAGFGGCAVVVIEKDSVQQLQEYIINNYGNYAKSNSIPSFIEVNDNLEAAILHV